MKVKQPFTDEITEKVNAVPEVDLSKIERANELGIKAIKDLSKHPELMDEFLNTYLIIFNDGTYTLFDCAESQLNGFINNF